MSTSGIMVIMEKEIKASLVKIRKADGDKQYKILKSGSIIGI